MSDRIGIAIDAVRDDPGDYRSAAARCRGFRVVDAAVGHEALVTDDVAAAIDAAEHGTFVLCLDPFGLPAAARSSLARSGRVMPGRLERSTPSIEEVKRSSANGKLGEPGLLRVHDWRSDWPSDDARLACQIDLACWMLEGRPSVLYALQRERYLQLHLGFDGGAMALLDFESGLPADQSYYSMSLIGSRGAAYADDHHNTQLWLSGQGTMAIRSSQREAAVAGMVAKIAHAVAVRCGFAEDWQDVEAAVSLAFRSRAAAAHQTVEHPGDTDA